MPNHKPYSWSRNLQHVTYCDPNFLNLVLTSQFIDCLLHYVWLILFQFNSIQFCQYMSYMTMKWGHQFFLCSFQNPPLLTVTKLNPSYFKGESQSILYSFLGLLLCKGNKSCACHPNSPVFSHISCLFIPLTLFAHPLFYMLAMILMSKGLVNFSLSNIPFVWKIVSKMSEFKFIVMCS